MATPGSIRLAPESSGPRVATFEANFGGEAAEIQAVVLVDSAGTEITRQVIQEPITYYASTAGGRLAFNITTQIVTISTSGEQTLAALMNPADSGKDIFLDLGEFGTSTNATFRRYRNSTITPTGTAINGVNTGSGATASVALMYVGGTAATFTRTGGTVSKTAHIAAYQQYVTRLNGRSVLRPGNSLSWTITPASGGAGSGFTASVFFEYWELPAA